MRVRRACTVLFAITFVAAACSRGRAAPAVSPDAKAAAETTVVSPPPVAAPIATVVRPSELNAAVAGRRDSLIARGHGLRAEEVGYYMDVQEARFRQIASTWLRVSRRQQRVVLSLPGALSFDVGKTTLSTQAVEALGKMARVLVEYRNSVVTLQGHTDSIGDLAMNQRLSEQRALAVARVLIAGGVTSERIVVAGYGATNPLATNATEEGRDLNRRVEVEVSPLHAQDGRR